MKHTKLTSLLGLLVVLPAYAQVSIFSDDVVVSAARIPQSRESVLADVSVIDREQLRRAGQSTLAELLQTLPGVEISATGGIGQNQNIFLRGTNSEHVVVLVDGLRIGSASLGTTLLENISLNQIERIEVLRGAASSLYGSDAVGGVIQIFTRQGDGTPHMSASIGYGSYNTRKENASLSGTISDTRYSLNVNATNSDGISPLRPKSDQNDPVNSPAGYRNLSVSAALFHQIAQGHDIGIQLYDSFNYSQYNDTSGTAASQAYTPYSAEPHPFQQNTQRGISLTSTDVILPWWESKLKIGQGSDAEHTTSLNYGNSFFNTFQRQASWQNNLKLPMGTLTLGADLLNQHMQSDTNFTLTQRNDNGWFASYLVDQGAHTFQLSMRRDENSQYGEHDTGNISYGYRPHPLWRVTGNYGMAFKAPTFDNLYWPLQNYGPAFSYRGNPNLKSETSRNGEFSVVYDQGHHRVSATAYHNEVNNLIVASQGLANDFPANVGSATIEGVTLAYEAWFSNFHVRTSADFQNPKNNDTNKLLEHRAREHGAFWLGQTWGKLEFGSEIIASSARFDDAANTIKLNGYALVNLTAACKLSPEWSIHARANNILDKEYALATDYGIPYSTPGANLFVSLLWQAK